MAILDLLHRRLQLHRLPKGIPALQGLTAGRIQVLKASATPLTLLAASIVFGFWAEKLARTEALRTWEETHPPSRLVWENALSSRGYHVPQDTRLLQQAARSLPALLDSNSSVWISPETEWIAVLHPFGQENSSSESFSIYCLRCKTLPKNWDAAGSGWLGFEAVIQKADKTIERNRAETKTPASQPKKHFPPDPRELRY